MKLLSKLLISIPSCALAAGAIVPMVSCSCNTPDATVVVTRKGNQDKYVYNDAPDPVEFVATVTTSSEEKGVTWSVDNTEIATISADGKLTPVTNKTGTVTVTATAKNGSGKKGTYVIDVVKEDSATLEMTYHGGSTEAEASFQQNLSTGEKYRVYKFNAQIETASVAKTTNGYDSFYVLKGENKVPFGFVSATTNPAAGTWTYDETNKVAKCSTPFKTYGTGHSILFQLYLVGDYDPSGLTIELA